MLPLNESASNTIIILTPVYNDWPAALKLVRMLDEAVRGEASKGHTIRILLVDDGSTEQFRSPLPGDWHMSAISQVDILSLRRNLGHQRAIAIGLCYIEQHFSARAVVVMDADGEDLPTDVPHLIDRFREEKEEKAVFAERTRRTERLSFRLFYRLYKGAHLALTGERVRVGNFSILPRLLLSRIVCVSDIWNHYAAAVFKARLPTDTIPLARGYRLDGKSKMNFVSLVMHGLSAMSVYGDRIGVRLLVAASVSFSVLVCVLLAMLVVRFVFGISLPNFVKTGALISLLVMPQILAMALMFVFIVLEGRDSSSFLPIRDYSYFIHELVPLWKSVKETAEESSVSA